MRPLYLREWMEHARKTPSDMVNATGADKSLVSRWLAGTQPGEDRIQKLASLFGATREQLHSKPPKPFATFDPDAPDEHHGADAPMTIGEHTGAQGIPSDASPQIDVRAGMGAGGVPIVAEGVPGAAGITFAAEVVADYWRLPSEVLTGLGVSRQPHSIIILPVQGTSMLPILMEGDYVMVDTRHRIPSPDGIYAIVDEFDSIVVKTLRASDRLDGEEDEPHIEIVSKNPEFPVKRRRAREVNVVGRVVRRFTADFGRDP